MQQRNAERLGRLIYDAELEHRVLEPLHHTVPGLSPADAYAVQEAYANLRLHSGATLVGRKIGCTSKPMQEMFQINTPDYGHIFDDMLVPDGGVVPLALLIQPMVELELAFVLGEDLEGPGATLTDVLSATEGIVPCIEIIDSRIRDWDITFVDTVADNGSSARCVLGQVTGELDSVDLREVRGSLFRNGELISSSTGTAVLGHPASAVAWLANALAPYGRLLRAGDYILSGSFTQATPARSGDVFEAQFGQFGSVTCSFG